MKGIKGLYVRLLITSIASFLVTLTIFKNRHRCSEAGQTRSIVKKPLDPDIELLCDPVSGLSNLSLPTAYVITPTYARLTQEVDLLRMCYTLGHTTGVHWILVEDNENKTTVVSKLLNNCKGVYSTHLAVKSLPPTQTPGKKPPVRHRGVDQRNLGVAWLRKCVLPTSQVGGAYFADDDNTYDIRVFDVVRQTVNVSMWKVGLVGGLLQEGPVCKRGKVTGWRSSIAPARTFRTDMSGFAVGLNLLSRFPEAKFSHDVRQGFLETSFLLSLNVTMKDITPAPDDNCSEVLAWHTQTNLPSVKMENQLAKKVKPVILPKPKFPVVGDDY